jgi:hypothetical protein
MLNGSKLECRNGIQLSRVKGAKLLEGEKKERRGSVRVTIGAKKDDIMGDK